MEALVTAPGVLREVLPTYVAVEDVKELLGCQNNKAYTVIREINRLAVNSGLFAYGQGKASKYIFSDKFGIPMDIVDAVINKNRERRKLDGIL